MPWWTPAWTFLDQMLRAWSKTAQRIVGYVRLARNLLVFYIAAMYALLVAAFVWPEHQAIFFTTTIVMLSINVWVLLVVVVLPLQAKSVVRLIDEGYPSNARELAIRAAVRKMRDESIETEEMLVEVAFNEGRKAFEKYSKRAEKVKQDLDETPADKP